MFQSVVTRFKQLYDTPQPDQEPRATKKRKLDQLETDELENNDEIEVKKPQVDSSSFLQKIFSGSSPQDRQIIESLRSQLVIQERLVAQLQQDLATKDQTIRELESKIFTLQSSAPTSEENVSVENIDVKQDKKPEDTLADITQHLQSPLTSEPSEPSEPNSPVLLEPVDEDIK